MFNVKVNILRCFQLIILKIWQTHSLHYMTEVWAIEVCTCHALVKGESPQSSGESRTMFAVMP